MNSHLERNSCCCYQINSKKKLFIRQAKPGTVANPRRVTMAGPDKVSVNFNTSNMSAQRQKLANTQA